MSRRFRPNPFQRPWSIGVLFVLAPVLARSIVPKFPSRADRVGECLVVGVRGRTLDAATAEALEKGRVAGLLLLTANIESIEQVRILTNAAEKAAQAGGQPTPILCIDQEGGKVNRLKRLDGFPDQPSAASLAAKGPRAVESLSGKVGTFMKDLGLNVDLAPDVDLDQGSGIIGSRSFGNDPKKVSSCASAMVRGLRRAGIETILKHFPGHGMTPADSHLELPVIDATPQEIETNESPFRSVMRANPGGVMLGHLLVPKVDPDYPASLSKAFCAELRQIVGPRRLIFTDSGGMGALNKYGNQAARAARSLSAGVDVYLTTAPVDSLGPNFDGEVAAQVTTPVNLELAARRVRAWRDALSKPRKN